MTISIKIRRVFPYFLLSLIFLTLTLPLCLKNHIDTFDDRDERVYHHPTIQTFVREFPKIDLSDYNSSTTPLYHLIFALFSSVLGSDIIPLRLINLAISWICLLIIFKYLFKRQGAKRGFLFTLLFILSPYFIGPAVRLSTDNLAFLFAILAIWSMDTSVWSQKNSWVTNIIISLTILTRQIYAWLIGVFFISNLYPKNENNSKKNLIERIIPILLPIAILTTFIILFKGLQPIRFQTPQQLVINWNAPVYITSLVGFFSCFFFFWFLDLSKQLKNKISHILILIILSLVYLTLHPLTSDYTSSYKGGALWFIASQMPSLFSCCIVFLILFPIGVYCLYLLTRWCISNRDYIIITCFYCWLLANMLNMKTFQKYYEPFILFFIGYTLLPLEKEKWHFWIGPGILIVSSLIIIYLRFF